MTQSLPRKVLLALALAIASIALGANAGGSQPGDDNSHGGQHHEGAEGGGNHQDDGDDHKTPPPEDSDSSAFGVGIATQPGITKYFQFEAEQTNATTLAAHGEVFEVQSDTTGVFGNFTLTGPVVCLRASGGHAVIGLIIKRGTGTAAAHVGEAFYLVGDDLDAQQAPDRFDNSGYTGTSIADCSYDQSTGQTVVHGDIIVDDDGKPPV